MAESSRNAGKTVTKPVRQNNRESQLTQLERRYRSTFKTVSKTDECTTVRFEIKPSDPDFPYDLESLKVQLTVPSEYPQKYCYITVMNTDIPRGFAFNLEKGFEKFVETNSSSMTLVRQMDWLDRNMESLLQQAPARTVRFVSSRPSARKQEEQEPKMPPELPKELLDTVSSKNNNNTAITPSPTTTSQKAERSNVAEKPSEPKEGKTLNAEAMPFFTAAQLQSAAVTREKEIHQLETRFRDNCKVTKRPTETVISLVIPLNDPEFGLEDLFGGELRLKYHIPVQYPLIPCSIEVENKGLSDKASRDIAYCFSEHVKDSKRSLFQNLNWLNRKLETILLHPPQITPTQEQKELEREKEQPPVSIPVPSKSEERTPREPKQTEKPQSQLLEGDESTRKDKRVIVVDDRSLLRPPGFEAEERSSEGSVSKTDDQNDSEGVQDLHPTEKQKKEDIQPSPSTSSHQKDIRKGTEIRFLEPRLENLSLFRCISLHLLTKCSRCKNTVDVENIIPTDPLRGSSSSTGDSKASTNEKWLTCPTCNSVVGVKFIAELMHQNASTLGFLQTAGCTPFDIMPSSFVGSCANCLEDMKKPLRLSPHDQPTTVSCFSCHAKLTVKLGEYRFVNVGQGGAKLQASQDQVAKLELKKKTKKRKEDALVVGQPLPDNGTCSHYRKSKRWFRFPCCHKLYPCDVCHDSQEDHTYEYAKRHVCGLCSREQEIKPVCVGCGHEFERSHKKGAFWEGGQGVRDRVTMSRKDPHKHKGIGKTVSKKQERVGTSGKEKRERQ